MYSSPRDPFFGPGVHPSPLARPGRASGLLARRRHSGGAALQSGASAGRSGLLDGGTAGRSLQDRAGAAGDRHRGGGRSMSWMRGGFLEVFDSRPPSRRKGTHLDRTPIGMNTATVSAQRDSFGSDPHRDVNESYWFWVCGLAQCRQIRSWSMLFLRRVWCTC